MAADYSQEEASLVRRNAEQTLSRLDNVTDVRQPKPLPTCLVCKAAQGCFCFFLFVFCLS
jgi:hypothetical protein